MAGERKRRPIRVLSFSPLQSKENGQKKMSETSVNILHTFADASVDMPHPHRVRTFMFKLLSR
jgi:hypothetical protein